ncbi:hypothetical protein Bca4012_025927 [Brassica carinata]
MSRSRFHLLRFAPGIFAPCGDLKDFFHLRVAASAVSGLGGDVWLRWWTSCCSAVWWGNSSLVFIFG